MPQVRQFLLLALAMVGFFLWQAWQQDQHRVATGKDAPSSSAAAPTATPAPPGSDVPSASQAPAAPPNAGASTSSVATPVTPEPTSAAPRVTIETDVLRVVLDSEGGSIISAALMQYPESITPGALPVRLLADDPEHYFVAQSGFVSADGKAPDHRAR